LNVDGIAASGISNIERQVGYRTQKLNQALFDVFIRYCDHQLVTPLHLIRFPGALKQVDGPWYVDEVDFGYFAQLFLHWLNKSPMQRLWRHSIGD
jgi:hypothetical protein